MRIALLIIDSWSCNLLLQEIDKYHLCDFSNIDTTLLEIHQCSDAYEFMSGSKEQSIVSEKEKGGEKGRG